VGSTDLTGVRQPRVEDDHTRSVATVFGRITAGQLAYRHRTFATCTRWTRSWTSRRPLLHRPGQGLRGVSALEGMRGSFIEAAQAVDYVFGVWIGTRQLTRAAAQDVADYDTASKVPAAGPGDALVITADSKSIPVRPGALRAGTAKLAAKAKATPRAPSVGTPAARATASGQPNWSASTTSPRVSRTIADTLPTLPGDNRPYGADDDQPAQAPRRPAKDTARIARTPGRPDLRRGSQRKPRVDDHD
jgi:hypothetical protein